MFLVFLFFLPFTLLLFTYHYWIFVSIAEDYIINKEIEKERPVLYGTIIFLCFYFLVFELKQVLNRGYHYFFDFWNYIEIVPLLGIIFSMREARMEGFIPTYTFFCIQTTIVFMLYVKMLFFMRLFRATGYLVHALIKILFDMRYFLIIFFTVILQFGFSLLTITLARFQLDLSAA